MSNVQDDIQITANEILEEIEIVETHFHTKQRMYGKIAGNNEVNAIEENFTPFRVTSGNAAYGSGVCVFGTADVIYIGALYFDLDEILIKDAQKAEPVYYRWAWGTGSEADAVAAGNYCTELANPVVSTGRTTKTEIRMPRLANGYKIWIAIKTVTSTQWVDFFVGGHGYTA